MNMERKMIIQFCCKYLTADCTLTPHFQHHQIYHQLVKFEMVNFFGTDNNLSWGSTSLSPM